MGKKRGHQDHDGSPAPKQEPESLQGVTYDSKRNNYKARINFAGREVYIGRCVLLLGTTLVFLSYPLSNLDHDCGNSWWLSQHYPYIASYICLGLF
jgi:hypothetical protein